MTEDQLDTIIREVFQYYEALDQESDRAVAILAAAHYRENYGGE